VTCTRPEPGRRPDPSEEQSKMWQRSPLLFQPACCSTASAGLFDIPPAHIGHPTARQHFAGADGCYNAPRTVSAGVKVAGASLVPAVGRDTGHIRLLEFGWLSEKGREEREREVKA